MAKTIVTLYAVKRAETIIVMYAVKIAAQGRTKAAKVFLIVDKVAVLIMKAQALLVKLYLIY